MQANTQSFLIDFKLIFKFLSDCVEILIQNNVPCNYWTLQKKVLSGRLCLTFDYECNHNHPMALFGHPEYPPFLGSLS